jgi:GTP-binding protein EngB required for normal cell division
MNDQVANLLARYARVIEQGDNTNTQTANSEAAAKNLISNYNSLRLADAALDKVKLNQQHPEHPTQIVVLGPTQAGKSTLCNLLCNADIAGISALAGFTVHAQGYAINCNKDELDALNELMQPLTRVASNELDAQNLNHYLLQTIDPGAKSLVTGKAVIWDSPDFDSIESSGYRGAVLSVAALADVIVFMVSKDKYGDKTVWDMLGLIRKLGKPIVVCINKLDPADQNTIVNSFEKRHQEQFNQPAPPISCLPFIRKSTVSRPRSNESITDATVAISDEHRRALSGNISDALRNISRDQHAKHTNTYIDEQMPIWMEPINIELDAKRNWEAEVAATITDAKERYATRYLNDPRKYDTFNKAIAELLTLLEIPGIADALSKTRGIVTWPVKKIFGLGKHAVKRDSVPVDQEMEALELILEQAITRLQGHILIQQQDNEKQQAFWYALQKAITTDKNEIRDSYLTKASQLQSDFAPRIEETAQQLYGQLQDQPALLNTLRAARASTDAAAVVLAVKSGGLAAIDLVIAPAMLSVTTLLTESVLGQYMERTKRQLQAEQQSIIDEQLIDSVLGQKLLGLAQRTDNNSLLLATDDELQL